MEAAIEAILFTMGDSVELTQIAKAVEQDKETTRKVIHHMMTDTRKKTGGFRSLNWETPFRCVPKKNITGI